MLFRRKSSGAAAIFGALELRVMEALWRRGAPVSVRDLIGDFDGTAYTTLMTTMDRLHRKGILDREKTGRAFVYRTRYSRDEIESGMAARALESLLDRSDAEPVLSYFIDEVSRRDARLLDELERLVQEKRREQGRR
ncbi:MAG TPA: BlaI/MecI/CopY family transcriptional regulator [Vicinamibacterales bacterium]|jgi:predicted transcriptional regulator|nr:BlaI/MecI/CopY family transcriptional regulator [Vicinamibacterales bacterium]